MVSRGNFIYHMNTQRFEDYYFDIGPMGPPSEWGSLLLRVTRNCPWNRCLFCPAYKNERFQYKKVEEIKRDINVVRALEDEIVRAIAEFGYGKGMTDALVRKEVLSGIIQGNPEIYGMAVEPETRSLRLSSLYQVAYWLSFDGKRVFLQDANSLIMRTHELVEVIGYLRERFPVIERITSYARSKTCAKKSLEEMRELHEAGLSRLHVGLESGCDEVLRYMQKGVTAEEHIKGGRNVVASGISLSEYVMPGLGGKRWSSEHALKTAQVINEINPDFIRIRSLAVLKDSPLYERYCTGEFEQLTDDEMVEEIRIFIENLDCNSYVVSDQMTNILTEIEGQLPQDKGKLLTIIEQYKAKPLMERLEFKLGKYSGSYCDYLDAQGRFDLQLERLIQEAHKSIQNSYPDAETKVDRAILAIKERGVP